MSSGSMLCRSCLNSLFLDVHGVNQSLKGYSKHALGGDLWKASELRNLPSESETDTARLIRVSKIQVAIPHKQIDFPECLPR